MKTRTEIIPAADNEVVSLELVKKHLRIDGNDEDDLIALYNSAAQNAAENYIGRAVGIQSLVIRDSAFEKVSFDTSVNDVLAKVEFYGFGGSSLTLLDPARYSVNQSYGKIDVEFVEPYEALATRNDAVLLTITRGYTPENCPRAIKSAILLMVGDLFERREDRDRMGLNSAAENLLRPFKKWQ